MYRRSLVIAVVMGGMALAPTPGRADGLPQADPSAAPPATPTAPDTQVPNPVLSGEPDGAGNQQGEKKAKEPGRGDFDAGGRVRLPSGPDEMGKFATFNWIALDLGGRYFLLDSITANANIPIALIKPDTAMVGGAEVDPSIFGGFRLRLDAMLPKLPFQPEAYKTRVGVMLEGNYMREGAVLLSDKDFPLFYGDFQPGFQAGAIAQLRLSSLLDFSLLPVFVYQKGSEASLTAVQIPMSLIVKLGSVIKVSADLGIFTGDDYSFKGDDGGRISAGGALDVKVGPIIAHAGAGVASLLTGGLYPSISDSVYVDLNVKFAK